MESQVHGQGADKQALPLSGPWVLIKDHTRHIQFLIYSFHTQRGAVSIVEICFVFIPVTESSACYSLPSSAFQPKHQYWIT